MEQYLGHAVEGVADGSIACLTPITRGEVSPLGLAASSGDETHERPLGEAPAHR